MSEAPDAGSHIEGVSYLNNFPYEEDSIRCWKAYKQNSGSQEHRCVLAFHSYEDKDHHMDTGEHSMEEENDTSFDRIRKKLAAKVSELQLTREQ